MRIFKMCAAMLLVFGFTGMVRADIYVNNFTAFGTVENCSYGASIEGDYAAVVDDEGPNPLYYYHFPTKTLTDVGLGGDIQVVGASLRNMKIAYLYRKGGSSWNEVHIAVFNILTRKTVETGISSADRWDSYRPMRFFDGDRVMFRDTVDGHIKYYSRSTGLTKDTGLIGSDPTISGDILAFSATGPGGYWDRKVAIHNLKDGSTKIIESGYGAVVAGNIVAYIARENYGGGEVKYYRIDSGLVHTTGITNVQVMSTDGSRIAIAPSVGSIKLYTIATGAVEDTGQWPCSGGWPCWLEIEGIYVAYELYEGGSSIQTDSGPVEIPEQDLNGDGYSTQDCAGGWFISGVDNSPITAILTVMNEMPSLNLLKAVSTSLQSNLDAAVKVLQDFNERNDVAAVNLLNAFINEVEAQRGISISNGDADQLKAAAQHVLDLL